MFNPKGPSLIELTRQALSSTTRGYDLLAPKFEHTPFRTPDVLLEPMARQLAKRPPLKAGLDMCCGNGAAMRMLKPLVQERVCGIDLSAGMLKLAAELLEQTPGQAEVELIQDDALQRRFEPVFDVVTCVGAFGHILHDQQAQFAATVWSALKPGGCFMFITAPMPSKLSRAWIISRGFNAVMHIRNALYSPPFIMFYLTFTLERAQEVLQAQGFSLEVHAPYQGTPFESMRLVVATKPEHITAP